MSRDKTVAQFQVEHKSSKPISFHMPGHKGRNEIFKKLGYDVFYEDILGSDITEIFGADNLMEPTGSIRKVAEAYQEIYEARHTELLTNGSSIGVISAILSQVPRGGKLILGKNSHHSAFSALRLGQIRPVYVRPRICKDTHLQQAVNTDDIYRAVTDNPDATAIFITSPNYYGQLADIRSIARIAHDHDMVIIVDQAHGAHLKFFDKVNKTQTAAESLGADIVIDGIHKNLFALTGGAILNVFNPNIDLTQLKIWINRFQTTSPSYLILGSLDINARIMKDWGEQVASSWQQDIYSFYSKARDISGLSIINDDRRDETKILISLGELGVSGARLDKALNHYNIWSEMVHGEYLVLLTGAGNTTSDYNYLASSLKEISASYAIGRPEPEQSIVAPEFWLESEPIPEQIESIPLYMADGRVLADPIISYPPGCPVVCPGEIINLDVISYITHAISRGDSIIGVDPEGNVNVGVIN